jgi:hypothetical protein
MSDERKPSTPDETVLRESRRLTRRSFAVGAAAAAAGYGIYHWIDRSQQVGRLQTPLRHTLEFDRDVSRGLFDERGLAPEYPLARATDLRLNGTVGLERELDMASWRLQVAGIAGQEQHPRYTKDLTAYEYRYHGTLGADQQAQDVKSAPGNGDVSKSGTKPAYAGQPANLKPSGNTQNAAPSLADRFDEMNRKINHKRVRGDAEAGPSGSGLLDGTPGLLLTMDDLHQLPKTELVTEFKCIEGWSEVVHWSGIRLHDLIQAYPPAKVQGRDPRYVYMETPDGDYYGGYDMAAAMHPQSLLVMEMGGQPLTQHHGAPLRLHMPIKYGYKQLKRIGLIAYMDERPDDYWTKLGYDWYAGL